MATTGLWPVKCRLKDVLDYADNPDKTTAQKYLDRDLFATLTYAGNGEKTDKQIYVDAINCPKQRAYQAMMAVKRRFGKLGGNVAYHGYQSFQTGEVTPEEALAIGRETAYRMWGDKFQVLVTVHLNTDNLHCHFVVNSVSYKDGSKFGNHQKDHIKLREISDQVCREYGKSVLKDASFWKGQSRGAYWYKKNGGMTHRDMLKRDIEYVLPTCGSIKDFRYQMEALGYTFGRTDEYYAHTTITAPGWKRPIRLDSLGYSREVLDERINANWDKGVEFYAVLSQRIQKWRTTALEDEISRLEFSVDHSYDTVTVLVDTLFLILITILQMAEDLMSPDLRHEARNIEQYVSDYRFLQREEIHTIPQLEQSISAAKEQISALERERSKADNTRRRAHTSEEVKAAKDERKAITEKMRPLREKVKRAEKIMEKSPHLYELLQAEFNTEREANARARNKSKEWSR